LSCTLNIGGRAMVFSFASGRPDPNKRVSRKRWHGRPEPASHPADDRSTCPTRPRSSPACSAPAPCRAPRATPPKLAQRQRLRSIRHDRDHPLARRLAIANVGVDRVRLALGVTVRGAVNHRRVRRRTPATLAPPHLIDATPNAADAHIALPWISARKVPSAAARCARSRTRGSASGATRHASTNAHTSSGRKR
jgi:hypothetical protein